MGGGDILFGNKPTTSGDGLTIGESFVFFGDGNMQTANPFAPPLPAMSIPTSVINQNNARHENEISVGDGSYLDSGLLNSLFGEVKTDNPWAGK